MAGTAWRAASDVTAARWAIKKESGIIMRPPFGAAARAATTDSSSAASRTGAAIASTANDGAAALKGARKYSKYGAVAGLNRRAALARRGSICLSKPSHLPAIVGSRLMKPVTLPPGRGKLATKPEPTGSTTFTKMIGMTRVCRSTVAVPGVFCVTMRSGCSATSSLANRCIISASVVPQRTSMPTLRPSVHPSFCSPSWNAATRARPSGSFSPSPLSTPIRRIWSAGCASAASGQTAIDPAAPLMKSRRLMQPSPRLGREHVKSYSIHRALPMGTMGNALEHVRCEVVGWVKRLRDPTPHGSWRDRWVSPGSSPGSTPGRRGCFHPRPPQTRTCRFPASGSSRGEVRCSRVPVDDHGAGKRMAYEECVEACPCEPLGPRSPFQPLPPQLGDLLPIPVHLPDVPRAAVVGHMADELRSQAGVLPGQRPVAVVPTPVVDSCQRPSKAVLRRRLSHHVLTLLRFHPSMGEAEKVERWLLAARLRATAPLWAEVDEARLVGMEREPVPFKPLSQHFQHAFGGAVGLEGHHEVIGIAHQGSVPLQARSHLVLEPSVQHMVQVDVREQR